MKQERREIMKYVLGKNAYIWNYHQPLSSLHFLRNCPFPNTIRKDLSKISECFKKLKGFAPFSYTWNMCPLYKTKIDITIIVRYI